MKSDAWCASMKYEFQTVVPCAKFAFDLLMRVVTQDAWRDLFLCVYWNKSEPWYVVPNRRSGMKWIVWYCAKKKKKKKKNPDSICVYATFPHAILCRQFPHNHCYY